MARTMVGQARTTAQIIAGCVLSCFAFAQDAPSHQIVRAARTPFDLARYVNSHDDIDWAPLWKFLGVDWELGTPRSKDSGAEVILADNPEQAIVIINVSFLYDAYLRYTKGADGEWRAAGTFFANIDYGNPHRHQIVRAGSTQFLVVSSLGGHGSGFNEEMEVWLDLSRTSFEPALSYVVKGHMDLLGSGISRYTNVTAWANSPTEMEMDLTVILYDSAVGDLGIIEGTGTYRRDLGGQFTLQDAHSGYPRAPIPTKDFEDFVRPSGESQEQDIRYILPRLKTIASGTNVDAKQWLQRLLERIDDIPEKRVLLELLAKP